MKNFLKGSREHVMKITNFKKLKMLPLIEKRKKPHYKQKFCYIYKNSFNSDIKIYRKVRDYDYCTGKYRRDERYKSTIKARTKFE